jgi:hypothetical protein
MSTAMERALEALRLATGQLDHALGDMVEGDPKTTQAAREAAEEVVITAWALAVRLGGLDDAGQDEVCLDDDQVRAFALGFLDGLRARQPQQQRKWIDSGSGPGWSPQPGDDDDDSA